MLKNECFFRNAQISTPKSFIKANSQIELQRYAAANPKKLSRLESLKGNIYSLQYIILPTAGTEI